MSSFLPYVIKSFKYDGHLHRMWLQNWLVPADSLLPHHQTGKIHVFINHRTGIIEADGSTWTSRVPGISFFFPEAWFNVVALIEEQGIRYYCNMASPPYLTDDVVTYIDYDLDVIVSPNKRVSIVDKEEYERHKLSYQYPQSVQHKIQLSLQQLLDVIEHKRSPFCDQDVQYYFELWKKGV